MAEPNIVDFLTQYLLGSTAENKSRATDRDMRLVKRMADLGHPLQSYFERFPKMDVKTKRHLAQIYNEYRGSLLPEEVQARNDKRYRALNESNDFVQQNMPILEGGTKYPESWFDFKNFTGDQRRSLQGSNDRVDLNFTNSDAYYDSLLISEPRRR